MRWSVRRRVFVALTILFPVVAEPAAFALDLGVSDARPGHDQRTGKPIVSLTLNEQSKRDFASFTSENIGQKAELRVDGKIVATPVIREPITGGAFELNSGSDDWTDEVVRDIAGRLSKPGAKVDVVIVK